MKTIKQNPAPAFSTAEEKDKSSSLREASSDLRESNSSLREDHSQAEPQANSQANSQAKTKPKQQAKIVFSQVYKDYGENAILKDINISIADQEFITILGPSGCGKTTLLRMVNKLESPTRGEIFINDVNIVDKDPIQLRRNIGYVLQNAVLFPHLTVEENILYVPSILSKEERAKLKVDVKHCMKVVNLDLELLERYPEELSGGQQQRVAIARALAANPDLILMDEPFSAVDEITREKLQKEIKRIQKEAKVTVLFVTHDVREALVLGDRVLILNQGEVAQFASPEEVQEQPASDYVKKLLAINN